MNTATRLGLGLGIHASASVASCILFPGVGKGMHVTRTSTKAKVPTLEIYTDGSRRGFGVGAAARAINTPYGTIVLKEHLGKASQYRSLDAEFLGAILGIRLVKGLAAHYSRSQARSYVGLNATLFMDCKEAIDKLLQPNLRKKSDGLLIRRFEDEIQSFHRHSTKPCSIQFALVKGHSGVQGNELVHSDAWAAAWGETSTSLSVGRYKSIV